jgi:hypothetical protein
MAPEAVEEVKKIKQELELSIEKKK